MDINNPYLGATPDGIVYCDCCGGGVLEVKCPYCYIEDIPEANETGFCMTKDDETWSLKRNHAYYYYQVQLQLHVCNMNYVDFVVWSQETTVIERIFPDEDFFKTKVQAARDFFKYGILPEIIGKWYTRAPVADLDDVVPMPAATSIHSRLWCYCEQPSFGQMIQCDNKKCSIYGFILSAYG